MKILRVILAAVLFSTAAANAQTNALTDAEIQGRALAQKIANQKPTENFTNTGVLKIRNQGGSTVLPLTIKLKINSDDFLTDYDIATNSASQSSAWLKIIQHSGEPAIYYLNPPLVGKIISGVFDASLLRGSETMIPFANSDFWLCDLGLEFFHWPQQKILKHETHRLQSCTVLESTNPNPAPESYSRVVSWIDNDSLGIVEAYAYDAKGKLLKDFYPKDFKKIHGQYQVQTLVMENVQTGSKSRIEFDLKK
jgi:Outer membrane lipoprotein-sorting protein